jgi:hypothetical protein
MAFLSVPMCFREQHHTDSGTPLFWLRLRRAVVKAFVPIRENPRSSAVLFVFPISAMTAMSRASGDFGNPSNFGSV